MAVPRVLSSSFGRVNFGPMRCLAIVVLLLLQTIKSTNASGCYCSCSRIWPTSLARIEMPYFQSNKFFLFIVLVHVFYFLYFEILCDKSHFDEIAWCGWHLRLILVLMTTTYLRMVETQQFCHWMLRQGGCCNRYVLFREITLANWIWFP